MTESRRKTPWKKENTMVDSARVELRLTDCEKALGVKASGGAPDLTFRGVSTDSRTVGRDELFVALSGDTFDGHEFIAAALARGAGGVIVQEKRPIRVPGDVAVLKVPDTLFALGELARSHRARLRARVVGITGSNGKTTTKEIAYAIIRTRYRTAKTEGNLNNLVGLPMMLLSVPEDREVIILEMGMNVPGEIERLARIACPDIGVVTNIGPVHLEGVGSLDGVIREKGRLLALLPPDGVAVFEGDAEYTQRLGSLTRTRKLTFGLDEKSDVRATDIEDLGADGTRMSIVLPSETTGAHLKIPGVHNLKNALAAAAVGAALGVSPAGIREGIESAAAVKMRMEIKEGPAGTRVLNDSYNANPVSTKAAIEFLARESNNHGGRSIAVLGEMLELGDFSRTGHAQVGEAAASAHVRYLFVLGDHASDVRRGALASGQNEKTIFTYPVGAHDRLISDLRAIVRPGDVILVKGSRGMKMERIAEAMLQ